jgi:outer membrane protein assembly factor BamB
LPKLDSKLEKKTEAPKNFYRFLVLCFDRNTGKPLWQRQAAERVPHEGHHQTHSYAAGSPTTDGKFLYVSFGSFGIYCYDFDGNLRWQRDLGLIQSRLGWGEAVTPVLHQGCLLLNWDQEENSALYCLEAATGQTRWKAERNEKTSWNTPLIAEYQGKTQIIVNGTNRIRSHDFETGQVLWSCGGMTVNAIPSPILVGDTVVCMSGYRGSMAVAIPLDTRGDLGAEGKVRWRYDKGTPYVPSPVLVGDRLYFTDRNEALLSILNAKTGAVILDRARLSQATSFYASPIAAADRIYLVDRNGTMLVLKQSDQLDVLAVNKLDDPIDASPVAVGKQLFLRGEKYLYCLEEGQGIR